VLGIESNGLGGRIVTTVEDRIRVLEDIEEIRRLTARYCVAIADGDLEALVGLYGADGSFESERGRFAGSDELRAFYTRVVEPPTNKPFVHNHLIDVDGDDATGIYAVEVHSMRDGQAHLTAGRYRDSYRRVGSEWLFASRTYESHLQMHLGDSWM
jgi:ketosteroid isomerase-like protein